MPSIMIYKKIFCTLKNLCKTIFLTPKTSVLGYQDTYDSALGYPCPFHPRVELAGLNPTPQPLQLSSHPFVMYFQVGGIIID